MDTIIRFVEEKVSPVAGRLSSQRHIKALQSCFMSLVAFMTIGCFSMLIMSPVADYTTMDPGFARDFVYGWQCVADALTPILQPLYNVTLGCFSLYVAAGMGFFLGRRYKMGTFMPVLVTTASYLMVCCTGEGYALVTDYLGSSGLFPALVFSIIAIELYRVLTQKKVGYIDLGSIGVPEAISDSLGNLFPALITLFVVSCINAVFVNLLGVTVPEAFGLIITPVTGIIDTPFGFVLLELLVCLLWWFGIHDGFITGPIDALLYTALFANMDAYAAGTAATQLPYIVTEAFWWSCMMVGGPACLMGLTIMCCFSKSKEIKAIGRVGLIPSIFNINEPILFGLPICYNATFLIPYLVITPMNGLVFYLCMSAGIINHTIIYAGWNMPTPLAQFFSTMDWRALVLTIILFAVDCLIWYPFLKSYEKQKLEEEAAAEAGNAEGAAA